MLKANSGKHIFLSKLKKSKDELREPYISKGLLGTDDRVSEILTGIIMILTFTCTFSVIKSDTASVMDMLTGAICSTIAWGLFDAVLYLYMTLIDKEHNLTFINFVRKSKDAARVSQVIVDALPSVISALMQPADIEALRGKILKLPEPEKMHRLKFDDYRSAAGIFLLVFSATIPISVPFILIKDIMIALRVSNIIAILMMFFCGAALGKYAGRNRILMGIMTSLIGITLVLITIALGG
jgi:VIT1/CCC1 family predicted Fe2+/Mn2+ transporter